MKHAARSKTGFWFAGRWGRASWRVLMVLVCSGVVVLSALHLARGLPSEMPAAFHEAPGLEAALEASRGTGRPVLVFATAEWCGPCQTLKRGALSDGRVAGWIDRNAHAAVVDLTDRNDASARAAAERLGVRAIPALILVRDGVEVSRREGVSGAADLLRWLESASTSGG